MSTRKKVQVEAEPEAAAPAAGSGAHENQQWGPNEGMSLDQLERLGFNFVSANELPDRFVAEVAGAQTKPDRTGRLCVFLRLKLKDGSQTVIKYTPLHIPELAAALRKLGVNNTREMEGKAFAFIKKHFRIGYARPIPVEKVGW